MLQVGGEEEARGESSDRRPWVVKGSGHGVRSECGLGELNCGGDSHGGNGEMAPARYKGTPTLGPADHEYPSSLARRIEVMQKPLVVAA